MLHGVSLWKTFQETILKVGNGGNNRIWMDWLIGHIPLGDEGFMELFDIWFFLSGISN